MKKSKKRSASPTPPDQVDESRRNIHKSTVKKEGDVAPLAKNRRMKISVSRARDGNLKPVVYGVLRSLPESVVKSGEHGLRHPLAIFNISLDRVWNAFRDVCERLASVQAATGAEIEAHSFDAALNELLAAQKELLFSLMSFFDECYLILKATYPLVTVKSPSKFTNEWLEQAGHPAIRQFQRDIRDYRQAVADIVNTLKHRQGLLRPLTAYWDRVYAVGYYVEGPNANQGVGPDEKLHPDASAFSFNRDLKFHLVSFYRVCQCLSQALRSATKKKYGVVLPPRPRFEDPEDSSENVLAAVANLPMRFFPGEESKPVPSVAVSQQANDLYATLSMPSSESALIPYTIRFRYMTKGDGVTRSFTLPYFGTSHKRPVIHGSRHAVTSIDADWIVLEDLGHPRIVVPRSFVLGTPKVGDPVSLANAGK